MIKYIPFIGPWLCSWVEEKVGDLIVNLLQVNAITTLSWIALISLASFFQNQLPNNKIPSYIIDIMEITYLIQSIFGLVPAAKAAKKYSKHWILFVFGVSLWSVIFSALIPIGFWVITNAILGLVRSCISIPRSGLLLHELFMSFEFSYSSLIYLPIFSIFYPLILNILSESSPESLWGLIKYGCFVAGLVLLRTQGANFHLPMDMSLVFAFVVVFLWHYRFHKSLISSLEKQTSFWNRINPWADGNIKGYYEASSVVDNALASRLGAIVIGHKSEKKLLDWVFGRTGWTEAEKNAIYWHEKGHNLLGGLFIAAEATMITLALKIACFGDFLKWYAIVTLLAWVEELLCDFLSGLQGLSLYSSLFSDAGFLDWTLGSTGFCSHPPLLFRLPMCFMFSIVIIGLLVSFFRK